MTDIVERLRERLLAPDADYILDEAADEIERLRAALRHLLADTQHAKHRCGAEDCPVAIARAALGENKR